eukprot:1176830-Prorocentrum_minimum.AAC.10
MTVLYPLAFATRASPIPVFPAVPSTTSPPGLSTPRSSASLMRYKAARSLTLPPGFKNSALPRISHPVASEAAFRRIRGVRPMVSMKESRIGARSPSTHVECDRNVRNMGRTARRIIMFCKRQGYLCMWHANRETTETGHPVESRVP